MMIAARTANAVLSSIGPLMLAALAALTGEAGAQSPLATPQQAALDRQALRVFASAPMQDQISIVERAFSADPYAATPEGRATIAAAAREVAFAAVQDSIDRDPSRPRLQWVWAPRHHWFGADIPASKVLMPNVDNVFRIVPVDSASHYQIDAVPGGPVPTQFTVQLLPALPGEAQWSRVIQEVIDTDIRKSPDGSFTLTAGPEPATDANHIVIKQAAHFLLIRDTLQDWHNQTPYRLSITRLEGPPAGPEPTDAQLAQESAVRVAEIIPQIRQAKGGAFANAPGFFAGPPNQLTAPKTREGGRWGLSSSGHFKIDGDEALAITLDPLGAQYLSVQLASGWLSSLDAQHHTATLNLMQAKRNMDGTLTVVIAARDPGLTNWLDTTGLHEGSIFVRWQKLPPQFAAQTDGIRSTRLLKLTDLASLPHISARERQAQITQRAADYSRRFTEQ